MPVTTDVGVGRTLVGVSVVVAGVDVARGRVGCGTAVRAAVGATAGAGDAGRTGVAVATDEAHAMASIKPAVMTIANTLNIMLKLRFLRFILLDSQTRFRFVVGDRR